MIKGLLQIREKRTDSEVWRPHALSENQRSFTEFDEYQFTLKN